MWKNVGTLTDIIVMDAWSWEEIMGFGEKSKQNQKLCREKTIFDKMKKKNISFIYKL